MKKLKVPTKRGVLLDGVWFGGGIDFIYAQTNDAFGQIETLNVRTNE